MNHEKGFINIFVSLPEESFEIAYGFISNYPITGIEEKICLLYTSPSPRDRTRSRMPSSA